MLGPELFERCYKLAENRMVWAKQHRVDWSVGEDVTHLDRQASGVLGECALCHFFGIEPLAYLERRTDAGPDLGIDFELPGVGSVAAKTTRAGSPEGLMLAERAKLTAGYYVALRHGYSMRPAHALLVVQGYAWREDWVRRAKTVTLGQGEKEQEVKKLEIGVLRDFTKLAAGVARGRA